MTITTTQVTADEALRAVADGKSVQMIWMDDDKPFFSDFTAKIRDAMAIGEAFLIVEVDDENAEEIADSQQKIADTCENAAEVHPEPKKKLDDGKITALYKAGWSAAKIADEMNTTPQTIHAHLRKLREGGRL